MPGCVLHFRGEDFDPGTVHLVSLQPYSVYRRGEKQFPRNPRSGKTYNSSGFSFDVSSADGDLAAEANDAVAFLKHHYGDLSRLASIAEIESRVLDFGYYLRLDGVRCCVQCDYLPAELLRLCGELGIDIELSLYPRPSDSFGGEQ